MHGNISNRPCSVTKPATVLLCLFALTAAGCASTAATGRWTHLDYHLAYNLPLTERSTLSDPLPESELVALTPSINIVSDNQRHEMLGGGVDWFRYAHADRLFKVAIRPPQLDLFGQDVMREMLTMTDGFVLHLGDACDVSNTGEFGRFAWDMQLATDGWAMTPGNHDGFFFGNSSRTRDTLLEEWERAAEIYEYDGVTIDSDLMQKDRVVSF